MTAGIRGDFIFFLVFMINMSLATHMNIFREQFDNEDDEKTQRPIIGECGVGLKYSYSINHGCSFRVLCVFLLTDLWLTSLLFD